MTYGNAKHVGHVPAVSKSKRFVSTLEGWAQP